MKTSSAACALLIGSASAQTLLLDNAKFVSQTGVGHNAADVSERHNCVLAYQCNNFDQCDRLIDTFNVPQQATWDIAQFRVYGIECILTDPPPSPPVSTITGMTLAIWSEDPGSPTFDPVLHLVFGDLTTNVLTTTTWTGAYRVTGFGQLLEATHPIMLAEAAIDVTLQPGDYWFEYGLDGSGVDCINQPGTPPNYLPIAGPGSGQWVLNKTPPRPLDPGDFGCAQNPAGLHDGLPFQIYAAPDPGDVGMSYCGPAVPNSTGVPAEISATGSDLVSQNDFTVIVSSVPPGQFGSFLTSQMQGAFNPPGSQGILCVVGNIGRFNGPGQIFQGPIGMIQVDLTAMPVNPTAPVLAGETWNFQAWYRDSNPMVTSNFSDGLEVLFQ